MPSKEQIEKMRVEHFNSYVVKPTKKKRRCISSGCGKTFVSNDAGHRRCPTCKNNPQMGLIAYDLV